MLALYHFDRSTAAQKVRLSLAEKGLEWESRIINPGLDTRDQHDPEYLRLNPRGVVQPSSMTARPFARAK